VPKYKPKTEKLRAEKLIKLHSKKGFNQSRTAEELGVTPSAINHRLARKPIQKALDEHIQEVAKRVGINLTWLLRKYKTGADKAEFYVGLKSKKDWQTQRYYMRDIAEIMKWIKTNGKDNGKGSGSTTIIISVGNTDKLLTRAEAESLSHQRGQV